MTAPALFFYAFSAVMIASAFMVIAARNPVHSVLFLILAFVSAAGLFMLLGAEFLAMILIVVYVGAVAVLFLFVVMMLDVDFAELKQGVLQYLPVGALVGIVLLIELALVLSAWTLGAPGTQAAAAPTTQGLSNGGRHDPPHRNGRRDRADVAKTAGCETAERHRAERPHPRHGG